MRRLQQQQLLQSQPHGVKRAADSSLESEQRLSKRFDLLNLGMHRYVTALGSNLTASLQSIMASVSTFLSPVPPTPYRLALIQSRDRLRRH